MKKRLASFKKKISTGAARCLFLAVLVLGSGWGDKAGAQPAVTAENMSLGGGGTAYLGGPEATFWNPANLFIRDQPGQFHLSIGQGAIQFDPLVSSASLSRQFDHFIDGYQPYTQVPADMDTRERNAILDTHFAHNKLQARNQSRSDVMLAGAVWQQKDYAVSIALRARYASHINVGRGWYDERFVEQKDDLHIRDFTLTQHRSEFYELAVGYAQEFTFINGLMPRLNTLFIGIAPKIIIAGPDFSARYNARYIQEGEQSIRDTFISSFHMQSSGNFSRATAEYLQSRDPVEAVQRNIGDNYQFEHAGYGLGFDFGLNYVIPLSNGKRRPADPAAPVDRSLRIGFSLNDIGVIRYHEQPLRMSSPADSSRAGMQLSANTMFLGAGGQYISYLNNAHSLPNPLLDAKQESDENYSTLLPTSINTGMLLELEHFKFTGDLTLGFNNTAFTTTHLAVHLGAEIRPLRQIPVRVGGRFASEEPFYMGLGTGVETTHWDFAISARALFQQESPKASLIGGAFGGLQFHF